jgi:hypothetical protein
MSHYLVMQVYLQAVFGSLLDRVRGDDRGAATAEQIVLIGAVIWQKMQAGANSIPTP